jgi:hypothetical protein
MRSGEFIKITGSKVKTMSRQIGKGLGSPVRNKRASILDDDHAKQIHLEVSK